MTQSFFHPWHSVSVGENAPHVVTAYIEIPLGSKQKYEIDKGSGLLFLDRVISSPVCYPANYGFIPQTYCDDGDALDILIMGTPEAIHPGSLLNARIIGAMKMVDGGEEDDKILAIHHNDPRFAHIHTLADLEKALPHAIKETEQFFKIYKLLEKKNVEVKGCVEQQEAVAILNKAIDFYNKTFKKN